MPDLRCSCGKKIAEYSDDMIFIKDHKCKTITAIKIVNGVPTIIYNNLIKR